MKNFFIVGVILSFFLTIFAAPSDAILIEFDPASQTVPVGDSVDVDLVISGLGNGASPSVSEFDLDISFDPVLLSFSGAQYGDQLDILGLGSLQITTLGVGVVNLFELSFDSPGDLDDFQAESFTMATLTFDTLAVGTSSLDISINSLADSGYSPLDAEVESGSISPVPEPATILLLAGGMAGLGVFGRKRFKK